MAEKKQNANFVGWVIFGLMTFGIVQFGMLGDRDRPVASTPKSAGSQAATPSPAAMVPLSTPRFVNVAALNVRHAPSPTAPLIMALPRGTPLRVLDRRDGWLLVDLNPTLEGWVTERFTTTQSPTQRYLPPASMGSK